MSKHCRHFMTIVPGLLLAASATGSLAATKTAQFQVRATLDPSCTIAASDLDFGSQGVLDASVDATSTISVTCTSGVDYNIEFNLGDWQSTNYSNRNLRHTDGYTTIKYQLYTDSARTSIWGNGNAGTQKKGGTGNGALQNLTVYGRLPTQSVPKSGTYTDTITATINY
ncbi:spore coat U domain-containing protein [Lysobacter cavernae]|uniref:Spore coat U domain-containing protein n=1 Tax=Lysobacter cavernae TaxID=1685901 RepID=A0ABV7RRJ5_9GAMM